MSQETTRRAKIEKAVKMAVINGCRVEAPSAELIRDVSDCVAEKVRDQAVSMERVQDFIEESLMDLRQYVLARAYIQHRRRFSQRAAFAGDGDSRRILQTAANLLEADIRMVDILARKCTASARPGDTSDEDLRGLQAMTQQRMLAVKALRTLIELEG